MSMVLDTSGDALQQALSGGGIWLAKPSQAELSHVAGRELENPGDIAAAAMEIVAAGQAEMVAVTLGSRGALLARKEGPLLLPALKIEALSAVGAGDSFLAAMLYKLAGGSDAEEAFRYGMAGGAAAVLDPGTDLAHPDDIARLYPLVENEGVRTF
jgi:6-phosphofructokinase 2